jgi:hypothetical protein
MRSEWVVIFMGDLARKVVQLFVPPKEVRLGRANPASHDTIDVLWLPIVGATERLSYRESASIQLSLNGLDDGLMLGQAEGEGDADCRGGTRAI